MGDRTVGPLGPGPRRRRPFGGRPHDPTVDDPVAAGPDDAAPGPVDDVVTGRTRPSLRQALVLVRMACGQVAIGGITRVHRVGQAVLIVVVIVSAATGHRGMAAGFAVVAVLVFVGVRLAVRMIERVSLPRPLRDALDEAKADLRRLLDALGLPTGPISGARFALRLARRGSRQAMVSSLTEAAAQVIPVVTASTANAHAALTQVLVDADAR